jgi:hypothetical protein
MANLTSLHNSRTKATLAASGEWLGFSEDVTRYGTMGVSFYSDTPSSGTLVIQTSHDNKTFSSVPRRVSNTVTSQPIMWNIVEKYMRIKYVNDGIDAVNLSIQTHYSSNSDTLLGQQLGDSLVDGSTGIATVSVIQGKDSTGTYNTAAVDSGGSMQIIDTTASTNTELLTHIHDELHLLNARFEEAFRTGINIEDIEDGYN